MYVYVKRICLVLTEAGRGHRIALDLQLQVVSQLIQGLGTSLQEQ